MHGRPQLTCLRVQTRQKKKTFIRSESDTCTAATLSSRNLVLPRLRQTEPDLRVHNPRFGVVRPTWHYIMPCPSLLPSSNSSVHQHLSGSQLFEKKKKKPLVIERVFDPKLHDRYELLVLEPSTRRFKGFDLIACFLFEFSAASILEGDPNGVFSVEIRRDFSSFRRFFEKDWGEVENEARWRNEVDDRWFRRDLLVFRIFFP